jgi:hypothetical protein
MSRNSARSKRAWLQRAEPHEPDSKEMPTVKLEILLTRAARFGPVEKSMVQREIDRAVEKIEHRFGEVFALTEMDP